MTPANASRLVLIRRQLKGKFAQIPNDLIRNNLLSSKSLGVIVYLLSLPSKNYHISLDGLCRARNEGEASMRSSIKQLESLGYLKVFRERSTAGRYVRSRWLVSDQPIGDWAPYRENPAVENPAMEIPDLGDQGTTNTEVLEIQKYSNTTTRPTAQTSAEPLEIDHETDREAWLWLCQKLSIDPDKTRHDCAGLNAAVAIDVLAEVWECKRLGSIKKSVPQFMSALLKSARDGKFNLSAGAELRKEIPEILNRQRRRSQDIVISSATKEAPKGGVPPMVREKLRQQRGEIVLRANLTSLTGLRK